MDQSIEALYYLVREYESIEEAFPGEPDEREEPIENLLDVPINPTHLLDDAKRLLEKHKLVYNQTKKEANISVHGKLKTGTEYVLYLNHVSGKMVQHYTGTGRNFVRDFRQWRLKDIPIDDLLRFKDAQAVRTQRKRKRYEDSTKDIKLERNC